MTDGGEGASGAPQTAGGPVRHVPVMLDEVLDCLNPVSGETIIDGTFGAGGYSAAILDRGADVIAIDRDPDAIAGGAALVGASGGKLALVAGEFAELDAIARSRGCDAVDGVVLDIGVSSMQLDEAERGFSFRHDGPLDMRMGQAGLSAADVVNHADQATLTRIFGLLGEERQAPRISGAIVKARAAGPIMRTGELARLIESTIGKRPGERIHPATRAFQGLRIFINGELEQLAEGLFAAERILKPGGRLVVVTFHSLEDRIVKRFFQDRAGKAAGSRHLPQTEAAAPVFDQPQRAAIAASEAEAAANPRARSAKLRWGVRTRAPARKGDTTIFKLPRLSMEQVKPRAQTR